MLESTLYYKSLGYGLSELRNRLYLIAIFRAKGFKNKFYEELENANKIINQSSTEPWWFLLLGKMYVRMFPSVENHTTISLQKYTTLMQG